MCVRVIFFYFPLKYFYVSMVLRNRQKYLLNTCGEQDSQKASQKKIASSQPNNKLLLYGPNRSRSACSILSPLVHSLSLPCPICGRPFICAENSQKSLDSAAVAAAATTKYFFLPNKLIRVSDCMCMRFCANWSNIFSIFII